MSTRSDARTGVVAVPLAALAIGAVIVALASLATLIVVVSVKGIDALSTLALALAVLAFVVQLIVFIVQASVAAHQSQQGHELHAQLISVLVQIQERTQGTQASVDRMNTRLLEAIIGKATGEGLDVNSTEFAERIASSVVEAQRMQPSAPGMDPSASGATTRWPPPLPAAEASRLHAELLSWPTSAEIMDLRSILESLADSDLLDVWRLATDERSSTRPGSSLGPGLSMDNDDAAVQQGLVAKLPGWDLYGLTPKGRLLGRLFTAGGTMPAELEEFQPLRDRIQQLAEERRMR